MIHTLEFYVGSAYHTGSAANAYASHRYFRELDYTNGSNSSRAHFYINLKKK
jgi:hypothetical protein